AWLDCSRQMRNRHFFLNSAILGSIALRLVLIEMVMGGRQYRFDQPIAQHFKRHRVPAETIGHAV
ncbi:hypothetical protein, partial [Rhizobium leguminosarum]|uniref:hypothetical protein n=1 Tax=Rhizobium leguminosarum TaxID=384 RepID=UPI003F98B60F